MIGLILDSVEIDFLKFVLAQYDYNDKPVCKKILNKIEFIEELQRGEENVAEG